MSANNSIRPPGSPPGSKARLVGRQGLPSSLRSLRQQSTGLTVDNDASFFDMSKDIEEQNIYKRGDDTTAPAVDLKVFLILAGGEVVPYNGDVNDGLANALSPPDDGSDQALYWVHVEADEHNREALDGWIDQLNLGTYISDQIKRPADEWMSNVMCTKSTALVMLRVLLLTDEHGTFELDEVEYLAAIVTTRMLLTYDVTNVTSAFTTSALIAHMTQHEALRDGSSSAALVSWLEFHVRNTKNAAIELRSDTVRMTKKMDLEPRTVNLIDILDLRGSVLFVDSVAEEQEHCLAMMKDMDTESDGADFEKVEGALQMLVKTAKSTDIMMDRMGKRLEDLKNAFAAHQQERMNQKLGILTVLSAIFMPLTFAAGVYGMNFDNIPELSTENGYFVWWGVMMTMGIAMTTYFYFDGWFVKYRTE
jgi:Mg2+ and Co2+ transporter CorA